MLKHLIRAYLDQRDITPEQRLERTINNLKECRKLPPTDEILAGRTMDEYYKDEAEFIIEVEDGMSDGFNLF